MLLSWGAERPRQKGVYELWGWEARGGVISVLSHRGEWRDFVSYTGLGE